LTTPVLTLVDNLVAGLAALMDHCEWMSWNRNEQIVGVGLGETR